MKKLTIAGGAALRGSTHVPGDKSITHRALLLSALASGPSTIRGALLEGDCLATLVCLRAMGVPIAVSDQGGEATVQVSGQGIRGLHAPAVDLYCERSGTAMRLLCGILAGQSFDSVLTGDAQLLRRPMGRIVKPLRMMGAEITDHEGCAPLHVSGRPLQGIDYELPVASAQVKSAILLAGLRAEGITTTRSPAISRDHTERMLRALGANVRVEGALASIEPTDALAPLDMVVPGDISSAAFLLAAGAAVPGSDLVIRNVGLNPTRTGILDVLQSMGADITELDRREVGGEPAGDLRVRASTLKGMEIGGDPIPRLIDELPVLAVAATQAVGATVIRDAAELRVKETDRIDGIVSQLQRLGAQIEGRPDGMVIEGPTRLAGAAVSGGEDHRVTMSLLIAGLLASGSTTVAGVEFIDDSYPGFTETLSRLGQLDMEVHT